MSDAAVMERLRAANPAPRDAVDAPALWTRIVSSPGDPRLDGPPSRRVRGWWQRSRAHRGIAVACGILIAACGSAAVAKVTGVADPFALLAHDTPLELFRAAPGYNAARQPALVPGSVRLAETFSVPHVGKVQYWTARNVKGWACEAFKLPNGEWAGTSLRSSERYGFGGTIPSCHGPWITWEGPHFHYEQVWLGANRPRAYGIVYGTVRTTGAAATVRDLPSGVTAPVTDHDDFVLVIPERRVPARILPWDGPRNVMVYAIPYLHLQALDARGHVLVTAPVDRITFGH